jgi:hypothetical protein
VYAQSLRNSQIGITKKTMPPCLLEIEALVSKSFATLGKDTSFSQYISYHFLHVLSVYQD